MRKCNYLLLPFLSFFFLSTISFAQTSSPILINEIGLMPFSNTKYIEFLVQGDIDNLQNPVNLEGWMIDNYSDGIAEDSIYISLGNEFNNVMPGTLILIYDQEHPHQDINPQKDGLPNDDGIYQLGINNPALSRMVKGNADNYEDNLAAGTEIENKWNNALPLKQLGDVVQLRTPSRVLKQAVSWTPSFSSNQNPSIIDLDINNGITKNITLGGGCGFTQVHIDYTKNFTAGTPGKPNSSRNNNLILSLKYNGPPPIPPLVIGCEAISATANSDGKIKLSLTDGLGPYNIQWTGVSSGQMTVENEGTYTINNLMVGQYDITVDDELGCSENCSVFVGFSNPAVSICGEACTLIGEETNNCFIWEPTIGLDDPNSSITEACPLETTEYTLSFVEEGSVVHEISYWVKVYNIGLSIYPDEATICGGNALFLSASTWTENDDFEYLWSNGETSKTIEIESVGNYSVTVTDPLTMCQEVAEIEVTGQLSISASIQADGEGICSGTIINLEAIANPPIFNYSYLWSTGETSPSIQATEAGDYSVTITNLNNNCETSADYNIFPVELNPEITSTSTVICPSGEVELSVENIYSNYEWSTNESGNNLNTILINNSGTYKVTVTNNEGCTAQDEITIGDTNDPAALKAYFEENGFYSIPITIIGPSGSPIDPNGGSEKDSAKSLLNGTLCDGDIECSGTNGFCVHDDAKLEIKIEGDIIEDVKNVVNDNLSYFQSEFGYADSRTYITSNEQACICDNYLSNAESFSDNANLGYWIHLWESGTSEDDDDLLFIRAKVPTTDEEHYPHTENRKNLITTVLEEVKQSNDEGGFDSVGERMVFTTQNLLLDNHAGLLLPNEDEDRIDYPICGNEPIINGMGMAPSCIPFQLPEIATMQFKPEDEWTTFFPNGAMTGFTDLTDFGSNGIIRYFDARINMAVLPIGTPIFKGYYQMSIKGTPLFSDPEEQAPGTNPTVLLGVNVATGGTSYIDIQEWVYTGPAPTSTTAFGTIVTDLFPCSGLSDQIPNPDQDVNIPAYLDPIGTIDISTSEYDVFGYGGILITIFQEGSDNGYDYIYAREDENGILHYYRWNCYDGVWEDYIPQDVTIINMLTSRLIAHQNDHTDEVDPIPIEDLDAPVCFFLKPDQVTEYTTYTYDIPNEVTGTLKDYAGIDGVTTNHITESITIAEERFQLQMQYLLSADDPSGSIELDLNQSQKAHDEFYTNIALSKQDPNKPDMMVWMHYKDDGVGLCIRFAEDFFTHNNIDDVIDGVPIAPAIALKTKAVLIDAIRDIIIAKPEDLVDDNPSNDIDPVDPLPPTEERGPWFFGLRPEHPDPVNFYYLLKEVAGIGRFCATKHEAPESIWKKDGDSMFDTPGGVIGVGQGIIEENPYVGLVQLSSFALSVVKEEEVRDGLIEAVKHPIKTAQGIYEQKKEIYTNPDTEQEVVYHEAGLDGVALIMALLTGAAIVDAIIDNLGKKAKETAKKLQDELGDIPTNRGSAEYDDFYSKLEELPFSPPNIDEVEDFLNFMGKLDKVHWKKFSYHPRLSLIWKKFKGYENINLKQLIEKFPDPIGNENFYDNFFTVIMDANDNFLDAVHILPNSDGTPNFIPKADVLLADLSEFSQGAGNLLDEIKINPDLLKSWDILLPRGIGGKFRLDVPTLKKMDILQNDSDFMTRLTGVPNPSSELKLDEFKKIFTSLHGNSTRFNPPCGACGNSGAKYLKESSELLEDIRQLVKAYPADMDGANNLIGLVKQGSKGVFDEFAQTARRFQEDPTLAATNVDNIGQAFPGQTAKKYDYKLKPEIPNNYIELKSWKKSSVLDITSSPKFKHDGQFGEYLKNINSIDKLKYSFDKRKLLDEYIGQGEGFTSIALAEQTIKDKIKTVLAANPDEFVDNMTDLLKLDLMITLEDGLTPEIIDQIVNQIVKVE